jgi:outer membrane lipopolysaccharide assembly protein LptE/RlpB
MKKIIAVAITALLSACGSGLDGTYTDQQGISSYTFKSGKVIVSAMGVGSEMDYKLEDGKVKIISPQGTMVMNILKDGSIEGPMGVKLTKQKD